MGDFVQQSITKTAVRELTSPLADIMTFNTLLPGVISGNPWSCTAYDVAGVPQDPGSKSRKGYTARIEFENNEAKVVGYPYTRAPAVSAFNAAVTIIPRIIPVISHLCFLFSYLHRHFRALE